MLSQRCMMFLESLQSLENKKSLTNSDEEMIGAVFRKILDNGESYGVNEIETWITSGISKNIIERITNIAHYQKAKYDAKNRLKMAPDSCGCGGDSCK